MPFSSCSRKVLPRCRMTSQKRIVRWQASTQYSQAACQSPSRASGAGHVMGPAGRVMAPAPLAPGQSFVIQSCQTSVGQRSEPVGQPVALAPVPPGQMF